VLKISLNGTSKLNNFSVQSLLVYIKICRNYVAATFTPPPTLLQAFKSNFANGPNTLISMFSFTTESTKPTYSLNTVACLDSRCNPYTIFSLSQAEAIVIRNPGGRVWSALPDILTLDSRFDVRQLVVLQHSDCGTSHVTKELIHGRAQDAADPDSEETLEFRNEVVKYKISHGENGVKEDLELLRSKGFLRKELVDSAVGFWLDTFNGTVKKVT
jgi:carbonic anhydrase